MKQIILIIAVLGYLYVSNTPTNATMAGGGGGQAPHTSAAPGPKGPTGEGYHSQAEYLRDHPIDTSSGATMHARYDPSVYELPQLPGCDPDNIEEPTVTPEGTCWPSGRYEHVGEVWSNQVSDTWDGPRYAMKRETGS